jgi:hypothetical protein
VEIKTSCPHKVLKDDGKDEDDEGIKSANRSAIKDKSMDKGKDKSATGMTPEPLHHVWTSDKSRIEDNGITLNRTFRFEIEVPYNKSLCPVVELFLYHYPYGSKKLLGSASLSLKETLAWFYGDEDEEDYKQRWRKFFEVNRLNKNEVEKERPEKFKVPKIKTENQLLYMDDMLYELPIKSYQSKKEQKRVEFKRQKQERERGEPERMKEPQEVLEVSNMYFNVNNVLRLEEEKNAGKSPLEIDGVALGMGDNDPESILDNDKSELKKAPSISGDDRKTPAKINPITGVPILPEPAKVQQSELQMKGDEIQDDSLGDGSQSEKVLSR